MESTWGQFDVLLHACGCRSLELQGDPQRQDVGDDDGRQLIGVGTSVKSRGRHEFKALLQKHIPTASHHVYFMSSSKLPNVLMHKQADLPGVGTVHATAYGNQACVIFCAD